MNPPPGILALPNGQWILEKDSHLSRWAEQHGNIVTDPHLMKFLKPHLANVNVVWTVGSNIGDHARQFADWEKQVVAIEPNPLAYTCLEHNVPEALCLPYAASDEDGSLNFAILENVGASRITPNGEWSVEAKRLDHLDLPAPEFIVIDVEGHEVHALRGMRETIHKFMPTVFIEVNRGALEAAGCEPDDLKMAFLASGYTQFTLYPASAKWGDPQFDMLVQP